MPTKLFVLLLWPASLTSLEGRCLCGHFVSAASYPSNIRPQAKSQNNVCGNRLADGMSSVSRADFYTASLCFLSASVKIRHNSVHFTIQDLLILTDFSYPFNLLSTQRYVPSLELQGLKQGWWEIRPCFCPASDCLSRLFFALRTKFFHIARGVLWLSVTVNQHSPKLDSKNVYTAYGQRA